MNMKHVANDSESAVVGVDQAKRLSQSSRNKRILNLKADKVNVIGTVVPAETENCSDFLFGLAKIGVIVLRLTKPTP